MFQYTVLTMQISSFLCPSDNEPGHVRHLPGRQRKQAGQLVQLSGQCRPQSPDHRTAARFGRRGDRQLAGERHLLHRVDVGLGHVHPLPDHPEHVRRRDQQHGHLQRVGQGPRPGHEPAREERIGRRLLPCQRAVSASNAFATDIQFNQACQVSINANPKQVWNWKGEWALYCPKIYSHTVMPNRYACAYTDQEQEWGDSRATITLINASSNHPGGVNMLFMDGSVRFIKSTVSYLPYYAIATPDGGETVSSDSY